MNRTRYSRVDMFNLVDLNSTDFTALQSKLPSSFSGSDLQMWFNDVPVAHINTLTATINREIIGLYGMGNADPLTMVKGKRAIVGSMTLNQFDRDAILYEVFRLHEKEGIAQQTDFMMAGSDYSRIEETTIDKTGVLGRGFSVSSEQLVVNKSIQAGDGLIGQSAGNNVFNERVRESAKYLRKRRILYADELPPFNITVVGANDAGVMSACALFGVSIAQMTTGWSMNDMTAPVTYSFTSLLMTPWTPLFE